MIQLGISGLRPEQRQSGGAYSDAVVRLLEQQVAGTVADRTSTAAVEAAAGALSRALAAAEVSGPSWARAAVSPGFLGQVGRDLVRSGKSLHVISVSDLGKLALLPASSWDFHGGADPETWMVRANLYGPSGSETRYLPFAGVVFMVWGTTPGETYAGRGPLQWASTSARLQSEVERSLADEAGGPIAQLLPIPEDTGEGDNDPHAELEADIRNKRGKALLVESTRGGFGEGKIAEPARDWEARRLGPQPPVTMDAIMGRSFVEVLSACGCPPGLFVERADGTAQRESYRRFFSLTVEPLAVLLAGELSAKLEADISLKFAGRYAADLAGRARAFQSMVKAGMETDRAAALAGLMGVD